jgi:hypothetical protein
VVINSPAEQQNGTTPYEVLRQEVITYMKANPQAQLFVTGHSLGGALATVFTAAFLFDDSEDVQPLKGRLGATYTFGQPRVGDYIFCSKFKAALLREAPAPAAASNGELPMELLTGRYVRVCNTYDIVTHIPPTYGQRYQHTGAIAYLKVGNASCFLWSESSSCVPALGAVEVLLSAKLNLTKQATTIEERAFVRPLHFVMVQLLTSSSYFSFKKRAGG